MRRMLVLAVVIAAVVGVVVLPAGHSRSENGIAFARLYRGHHVSFNQFRRIQAPKAGAWPSTRAG